MRHGRRAPKEKKTFVFTGLSSGGNYGVYNNSIDAIERAVKERVLLEPEGGTWKEPFRPSVKQFNGRTNLFTTKFKTYVRYSTPMSPLAFANTYTGRKRTILLKAVEMNSRFGFTDRSAMIRAFVKHEKYLFTPNKLVIPRLIQPRDHRYIVETGRYMKPIEKFIYKIIDTMFNHQTVCKGLNMEDRGNLLKSKWDDFVDPVAVGLDARKFDRCVSNSALQWEHSIYQMFYPGDKHLKRLMRLQRNNNGVAYAEDGYLKYRTKHNRASGDSNTSSGNVLIMCALAYDYFERIKIRVRFANDGDDCVVFLERKDLPKLFGISKFCERAGVNLVTEDPVDVFEKIEFCQAQPVRNQFGGYTMVRNVRKSVGKDAVALKPLDNLKIAKMWMAAVGDGGMALCSGIPVMQEYYEMYKRSSCGAEKLVDTTIDGGFYRLSKGMAKDYVKPTPESRLSFWLAFDITPAEQLALEEYYRKLTLGVGQLECRFNYLPI